MHDAFTLYLNIKGVNQASSGLLTNFYLHVDLDCNFLLKQLCCPFSSLLNENYEHNCFSLYTMCVVLYLVLTRNVFYSADVDMII